jgi:hypothetical protein
MGISVSNVKSLAFKNNLLYQTSTPLDISNVSLANLEADYSNIFPIRNVRWMGSSISHSEWVSRGYGVHDILSDPQLVDPSNGNFKLSTGSPAIDRGVDVGLPYIGNAPDLGASEHFDSRPQIVGDLNLDGTVDQDDIQICINGALGIEHDTGRIEAADINGDQKIDSLDLQEIINIVLNRSG